MNSVKTILISKIPLPYDKIGSWSTMYDFYLKTDAHQIDYILCPKPKNTYDNLTYHYSDLSTKQKIEQKFLNKNKNYQIFKILQNIIKPSNKYIIQFIDEFGTIDYIADKLNKKYGKQTFYYQFFYHGYAPFYENFRSRKFYDTIDEMVLLTHKSYHVHKEYYTVLPCKFSVLYNGVDTNIFKQVSLEEKIILRKNNQIDEEKIIFLWLSQDRPKKGLDFIINIWKTIPSNYKNKAELWIIGSKRTFNFKGIKNFGVIPNNSINTYYQMADVYLFPTLCHEGFGLSLIEALNCGCYCVASDIGGVSEVLQDGKLGKLISKPHLSEEWKANIMSIITYKENYLKQKEVKNSYTLDEWVTQMNGLIIEAKKTLL